MIRVLKPDADPSLVLALIGPDLVTPPAGTTDIPETEDDNASRSEEIRTVEPGEEVEQQPQAGEAQLEEEQGPEIEAIWMEERADTTVTPITELGPSPTAGVPEETHFEVISTETTVTTGPRGDAEQLLLTPEEVIANPATRSSEGTEVDVGRKEDMIIERAEMITDAPKTREIVVVTDEEEGAGRVFPRDESTEAGAVPPET